MVEVFIMELESQLVEIYIILNLIIEIIATLLVQHKANFILLISFFCTPDSHSSLATRLVLSYRDMSPQPSANAAIPHF